MISESGGGAIFIYEDIGYHTFSVTSDVRLLLYIFVLVIMILARKGWISFLYVICTSSDAQHGSLLLSPASLSWSN